jgi:hypothetical protein
MIKCSAADSIQRVDRQHAVLGIVGKHHEAHGRILFSAFLLGLRDRQCSGSLAWGLTLGSWGGVELSFVSNINQSDSRHIFFAVAGGGLQRGEPAFWLPP